METEYYRVVVVGEAKTGYPNLKELDGVTCKDDFTEYMQYNPKTSPIKRKGISSGYMEFKYLMDRLWTVTTYKCPVELSQKELNDLKEYTIGQWSDGIGETFEQFPCKYVPEYETQNGLTSDEAYISPWYSGQIARITQLQASEGEPLVLSNSLIPKNK